MSLLNWVRKSGRDDQLERDRPELVAKIATHHEVRCAALHPTLVP